MGEGRSSRQFFSSLGRPHKEKRIGRSIRARYLDQPTENKEKKKDRSHFFMKWLSNSMHQTPLRPGMRKRGEEH